MVTKGYRRGVYEWVEKRLGNGRTNLGWNYLKAECSVLFNDPTLSGFDRLGFCSRGHSQDHDDEDQRTGQLAQNFPGYVTHLRSSDLRETRGMR